MWFLKCLSIFSIILEFGFASLAIASGLYYLAELVEEYATAARKIIRSMIFIVMGVFVGLFFFEDFPLPMILCGLLAQLAHLGVMKTFPYFVFLSPYFLATLAFLIINHYFAFTYFDHNYHFSEVMAYFIICMWSVPFAFFVSLSANDLVLPSVNAGAPGGDASGRAPVFEVSKDNDVVSNYFRHTKKKLGLLQLFKSGKAALLPDNTKKAF